MPRKTKAEAEVTRQTLLQSALAVFSHTGYAAARLDDIAREAGVTRGAIYWHFTSKADLYSALVADATARLEQVIGSALAEGGVSYLESTRRVMTRMLAYLEEDETYRAVQALLLTQTGMEDAPATERQRQIDEFQTKERELAAIMRAGIQAGQLRADLDPEIGARAMLTYLNGIMAQWLIAPDAFSVKASAPSLVDIYIRGIAAHS